MGTARRLLLSAVFVGVLAAPARAGVHRDDDLGWTMSIPRGWNRIPLPPSEKWVVAKYLSERRYASKDGWDHVPEIKVVYFPAGRDLKAKEERKEEKIGENTTVITTEHNYRDFKDYLRVNNSGSGFYISREEEVSINGIRATWFEVKWEKLTTPRRALAVVFHRDVGADYAVTFEVLEEQWDKLGRDLANAVRTFRFVDAKKDLRAGASAGEGRKPREGEDPAGPDGPGTEEPTGPLTPEEMAAHLEEEERRTAEAWKDRRAKKFQEEVEHFRKSLPKGWREVKSKNFVCFTHADDKYTKRALDQAEGMRAWMDRTFGSTGKGEISPLIIRLCGTREEQRSFQETSGGLDIGGFWGGNIHYTTNQERMGSDVHALGWMNSWVMRNWFEDRDRDVFSSVPSWVRSGLDAFAESGILAKGRFDFRPDTYEVQEIRKAARQGTLFPLRDLLKSSWEDFNKVEGSWMQPRALVRYLMDGPGASDKRTRGKLHEILRVCGEIEREERKERLQGESRGREERKPLTEEEEEEMAKKAQEESRQKERAFLEEVAARAFKDLSDAEWEAVDRQWRAWAAQYR